MCILITVRGLIQLQPKFLPILKPHGLSVISVKIFEYFAAHSLGTTGLDTDSAIN
jgi:hypothetical protein